MRLYCSCLPRHVWARCETAMGICLRGPSCGGAWVKNAVHAPLGRREVDSLVGYCECWSRLYLTHSGSEVVGARSCSRKKNIVMCALGFDQNDFGVDGPPGYRTSTLTVSRQRRACTQTKLWRSTVRCRRVCPVVCGMLEARREFYIRLAWMADEDLMAGLFNSRAPRHAVWIDV